MILNLALSLLSKTDECITVSDTDIGLSSLYTLADSVFCEEESTYPEPSFNVSVTTPSESTMSLFMVGITTVADPLVGIVIVCGPASPESTKLPVWVIVAFMTSGDDGAGLASI